MSAAEISKPSSHTPLIPITLTPTSPSNLEKWSAITLLAVGLIAASVGIGFGLFGGLGIPGMIANSLSPLSIALTGAAILGVGLTIISLYKLYQQKMECGEKTNTSLPVTKHVSPEHVSQKTAAPKPLPTKSIIERVEPSHLFHDNSALQSTSMGTATSTSSSPLLPVNSSPLPLSELAPLLVLSKDSHPQSAPVSPAPSPINTPPASFAPSTLKPASLESLFVSEKEKEYIQNCVKDLEEGHFLLLKKTETHTQKLLPNFKSRFKREVFLLALKNPGQPEVLFYTHREWNMLICSCTKGLLPSTQAPIKPYFSIGYLFGTGTTIAPVQIK